MQQATVAAAVVLAALPMHNLRALEHPAKEAMVEALLMIRVP
jgi:hypothetical protein